MSKLEQRFGFLSSYKAAEKGVFRATFMKKAIYLTHLLPLLFVALRVYHVTDFSAANMSSVI
ncbi:MAG: hypothetical protein AAGF94_09605 [Pseudomonadota bacterium]